MRNSIKIDTVVVGGTRNARSTRAKPNQKSFRDSVESEDDDEEGDEENDYLSPLECSEEEDDYDKENRGGLGDDSEHVVGDENSADAGIRNDNNHDGRRDTITLDQAMALVPAANQPDLESTDKFAPRKSTKPPPMPQRRRRKSSSRFLRLSNRFGDDDRSVASTMENTGRRQQHRQQLGEMYRRAIQLNAENKINAANSWGLPIIEHMDKFLGDDDVAESETHLSQSLSASRRSAAQAEREGTRRERRVNFTKASSTIDTSVKIYSYRVDDVHLSSYKVLANLNRTGTKDASNESTEAQAATDKSSSVREKTQSEKRGITETIESNVSNINTNSLDSAYDIDPLFHKMSKTFDEGGARGLLLVNLGVAADGCRVILDSKEERGSREGEKDTDDSTDDMMEPDHCDSLMSELTTTFNEAISCRSLTEVQLVPQLEWLRQEFKELERQGYVDNSVPKARSKSYSNSEEEEKEAELSIHREAQERSRLSQANTSYATSVGGEDDGFGVDDYGGDDVDDDFDGFAAHENGALGSSLSPRNITFSNDVNQESPLEASRKSTSNMLDAICSGNVFQTGGDFEYFDTNTLERIMNENKWAGSAFWKRSRRAKGKSHQKKTPTAKKEKAPKHPAESLFIDFFKEPKLDDILKDVAKSRGRKQKLTIPMRVDREKHLLPPDASISVEDLSKLFMRPRESVTSESRAGSVEKSVRKSAERTVGFHESVAFADDGYADDCSFGGDDNGAGFNFASEDVDENREDEHEELAENIRKVDKVEITYATVAKKVDVKRLKKDLWAEVESRLQTSSNVHVDDDDDDASEELMLEDMAKGTKKAISFGDTVCDLDANQGQSEVTLPFYFICILHLANEKELKLDSGYFGLEDFTISQDSCYC